MNKRMNRWTLINFKLTPSLTPQLLAEGQLKFFGRTDGGEFVFDVLDEVLSNKIYPKIN